jgi:hypothetical protein
MIIFGVDMKKFIVPFIFIIIQYSCSHNSTGPTKSETIEMKEIPSGTFQMGQISIATPVHTVNITKAFYIGPRNNIQTLWDLIQAILLATTAGLLSK